MDVLGPPDGGDLDGVRHAEALRDETRVAHVEAVVPVRGCVAVARECRGDEQVRTHVSQVAVGVAHLAPEGAGVGKLRPVVREEAVDALEVRGG